ncbi:beta-glucanase [Kordia sp. SMS9]|uniref:family 16 glycosylhydrolase n=1 Tax=Kordia sp. SMS9 TaxID=2282170 RepID=UPI000E0D418F|nr:family 16 glycosylhydrolase [Kordia sp. SMS9]AXG70233.1 beta-glucanase [Kordia sp. SMS9]
MNIKTGTTLKRKFNHLSKYISRKFSKQETLTVFGDNEETINAIYVLNLDHQKKRWTNMLKEVKYQKVKGMKNLSHFTQRISAINGSKMDLDQVDASQILQEYSLKEYYHVDPDPRLLSILRSKNLKLNLTRPETAIGLSHIKMWRKIVEENSAYALILEDDIFFEKDFAKVLNQVWRELPQNSNKPVFDFLYLSYEEVKTGMVKDNYSQNLVQPHKGLWWFSGYVLSLEGAQKLLAQLPIRSPVDVWINFIFSKLNVYAVKKPIINQREDIDSDNVYSILTMLNQTNDRFDKKKGKTPVFVVAESSTSSILLGEVLKILGYRCCMNTYGDFTEDVNKSIERGNPLQFEAFCGFEEILKKPEALKKLPSNSVFIVVKDATEKVETTQNYLFQEVVKSISEIKQNRCMMLDMHTLNDWQEICEFLNCETPSFPLPKSELLQKSIDTELLNLKEVTLVPVQARDYTEIKFDLSPWIIPFNKRHYVKKREYPLKNARLVGKYTKILEDDFSSFNESIWTKLEDTFKGNLCLFSKDNFLLEEKAGCSFVLKEEKTAHREFTSASIVTQNNYRYGRFEVEMKPAKGSGIVSAFFLFRYNPWQEIDVEFLGDDTTKVMFNIYYNPGVDGVMYNYGNKAAPIKIDLGFDASLAYHTYSIEWEPHEVRFYVDTVLVHVRSTWMPSLIPDLPLQFYFNIWAPENKDFAGPLANKSLPKSSYVRNVKMYSWSH